MNTEAVAALITGLKRGGIDFVTSVPTGGVTPAICAIMDDPDFTHVPVTNECNAIEICTGAYLGGKKPAFVGENTGVILATYPILTSIYHLGGAPILLIVDHQGDFGGPGSARAFGCGFQLPRILDSFQIYCTHVFETNKLISEVMRAAKTAQSYHMPAAVLLSGEEIHGT